MTKTVELVDRYNDWDTGTVRVVEDNGFRIVLLITDYKVVILSVEERD
jgi:hypothetical protein